MKQLDLHELGIRGLEIEDMLNLSGGKTWWGCINNAYADLTDGPAGCVAVAVFTGPCLLAIAVGGTINYLR